jgi:simple sugar transport system permease protein
MTWFGTNLGNGFYSAVLWWIGLAIVLSWVLRNTRFGNHVFATGGDADAARSMGVNTTRIKLLTFTLCGFLAGLAGVILFSVLPDLSPTSGESYELYAIAAAVIGGTALSGGSGTILGTLLGTLLMGVVQTGLVHAKVENYWFRTFVGIMLVLAVILNVRIKVWMERLSR